MFFFFFLLCFCFWLSTFSFFPFSLTKQKQKLWTKNENNFEMKWVKKKNGQKNEICTYQHSKKRGWERMVNCTTQKKNYPQFIVCTQTKDKELNVKLLSVENIVIWVDCRMNIMLWYGNKSLTKEREKRNLKESFLLQSTIGGSSNKRRRE